MIFLVLLVTGSVSLAAGELPKEPNETRTPFDQANEQYERGQFAEAIASYEKLLNAGEVSSAIYFNLGNAHFKAGQMGRAILNYRLASQLAPRDPDIRANLQFARNTVGANPSAGSAVWRGAIQRLTLNEWSILAATALWAWLLLLAVVQWRPAWKAALRTATFLAGIGLIVFGAGLALAWNVRFRLPGAIVVAREAVVRNGPLDESPSSYTVRDGVELEALDVKDGWLQVRDAANRIGWVRAGQVVMIPAGARPGVGSGSG